MPDYHRNRVPGGIFFLTVNLLDRRSNLLVANIDVLRDAVRRARSRTFPYRCLGRPPRPHALGCATLGTLPQGDAEFSGSVVGDQDRVREIAADWRAAITVIMSRGERGIWQRRYWEPTICDDRDFAAHMDYMHFNPVKHGLVAHPPDWPHSSFRRCVTSGMYPADWRGGSDDLQQTGERQ